jgi:hypothetical protein
MQQLSRTADEVVNHLGHQNWYKVVHRDFGNGQHEVVALPYETWSEPDPEPPKPFTERGEGDRQRSIERAARRAKTRVRHICKLIAAKQMMTLSTQENIQDESRMQALFKRFRQLLAEQGYKFQYVATLEKQQRGALHLHIAVKERFVYKLLWACWEKVCGGPGTGRVHMTAGGRNSPMHKIACYIAKYVSKAFEQGDLNKKRYWQGGEIPEPRRTVQLLRGDWDQADVIHYCWILNAWVDKSRNKVFWMAVG